MEGQVVNQVSEEHLLRAVESLRGKWTIRILFAMRERPVRLGELRRMIPSASKKGLTSSLRLLEAAKVIVRNDLSQSVLHVEYEIAEDARTKLTALMRCLADWGEVLERAAT